MLGHYNSYTEMKIKIYQWLLKQNALTEQTFKIYALFQESLKKKQQKMTKKNQQQVYKSKIFSIRADSGFK